VDNRGLNGIDKGRDDTVQYVNNFFSNIAMGLSLAEFWIPTPR